MIGNTVHSRVVAKPSQTSKMENFVTIVFNCNFIKKETPTQVFFCAFCQICPIIDVCHVSKYTSMINPFKTNVPLLYPLKTSEN